MKPLWPLIEENFVIMKQKLKKMQILFKLTIGGFFWDYFYKFNA